MTFFWSAFLEQRQAVERRAVRDDLELRLRGLECRSPDPPAFNQVFWCYKVWSLGLGYRFCWSWRKFAVFGFGFKAGDLVRSPIAFSAWGLKHPTSALRRKSASSCPQLLVRVLPKDCALDHASNEVMKVLKTCAVAMYVDTYMCGGRYVFMHEGVHAYMEVCLCRHGSGMSATLGMHVCMCVCTYVCMHVGMHECMYACVYEDIYIDIYVCACVCVCVCTCVYVCVCATMHLWMHVCMYFCMQVCTQTCMHPSM